MNPSNSREACPLTGADPLTDAGRLLQEMRQRTINDRGAVPVKYKLLAAALWSVAARCEPCIGHYLARVHEAGGSDEEIREFLAVATVMGGCVGEMWANKGLENAAITPAASDCGCADPKEVD